MPRALAILAFLPLVAPAAALAAAPHTFQELASLIVDLLNHATIVLMTVGLVIYFYGISTNILNFGEKGAEKIRAYFLWGIIVLFVMVSIWGILNLHQNTLFGGSGPNAGAGASQSPPDDPFQAPQFGP